MNRTFSVLLSIALSLLMFVGCKKADNAIPVKYGTLWLHLHNNFGSDEIEVGDTYTVPSTGNKLSFNTIRYYISNIVMTDTSGKTTNITGAVLTTLGTEDYSVGQLPVGVYRSISFKIGLTSFVNHTSPSSYFDDNVLAAQNPTMHFETVDSGYYFMQLLGKVDTSGAGIPNKEFTVILGIDGNDVNISMPVHSDFIALENQPLYIHMNADYKVLFTNVDVAATPNINPRRTATEIHHLRDNMQSMFSYEL